MLRCQILISNPNLNQTYVYRPLLPRLFRASTDVSTNRCPHLLPQLVGRVARGGTTTAPERPGSCRRQSLVSGVAVRAQERLDQSIGCAPTRRGMRYAARWMMEQPKARITTAVPRPDHTRKRKPRLLRPFCVRPRQNEWSNAIYLFGYPVQMYHPGLFTVTDAAQVGKAQNS